MEEKSKLAVFIAEKRNKAGLTQKELAEKLYVSDTAVSKWERGLSYPDITLVPKICRSLDISEHEFFTACDDMVARRQQKEIKNYHTAFKVYQVAMCIAYGAALLTCFIVELAVSHTLSWFFIVAASVLTGFTITHLPFLLKRHRLAITLGALMTSVFLLLWVIWRYTGGAWLLAAFGITALSFLWLWLSAFVLCRKGWPWTVRGGVLCLLYAILLAGMNPLCGWLFGYPVPFWWEFISPMQNWSADTISNKIVFWVLLAAGAGLLAAAALKAVKQHKTSGR